MVLSKRSFRHFFLLATFGFIIITCCNKSNGSLVNAFSLGKKAVARPSASTQLSMEPPELNEWKVLDSGSVVGTVRGHPAINDGDIITTSPLQNPDAASRQTLVQTASGTTYKLLEPMPANTDAATFYENSLLNGESAAFRDAALKFNLNMRTVGMDEEYYLAGKPTPSTSGKSNIWEAYRTNGEGVPTEPPLCVKISSNIEAVSREFENYKRIGFPGIGKGRFVNCIEYLPVAGYDERFRNQCALVLEMGSRDLKSFLDSRGRLVDNELKDACASAAQCVQSIHAAGLVWTDLKTENFVVMPDGQVKGIDLESAMPHLDNPVDYSPEACPPEFAKSFLEGDAPYFILNYSYDVWSLGMLYLELASGRGVFDNKTPSEITKLLSDMKSIPINDYLGSECDDKLKDLINQCLQVDPKRRPNVSQVLSHPYFTSQNPFFFMNR